MVYVMRNGRRVIVALSFLLLCCGVHVHAQRVAVKTNALGWLTASPNVEAEFVLGSHVSLNIGIAANPISTDNFKTTFTHFQPEVRYWLNRPMVSHFLGITAFVNNFNMMVKDVHHKGEQLPEWVCCVTVSSSMIRVFRNRMRSTIVRPPLHLLNWGYPLCILFDNEH
mgnify:CR=1 FL=1